MCTIVTSLTTKLHVFLFPLIFMSMCAFSLYSKFAESILIVFIFQDKNHRFMALDCLHRVLRFYLSVHGDAQPPNRVWDYLDSVTSQLLTILRKGMLTQDVQHDKLVEFCVTIAEHNLDFAMNHTVLELLKQESPEAKVIGLRALLAIVMSPTSQHVGLEILHGGYYLFYLLVNALILTFGINNLTY